MNSKERVSISFFSSKDSLLKIEKYYHALLPLLPACLIIRQNIKLCFYEVLANAVSHGNKYNEKLQVHIEVKKERSTLVLSIQDEGEGFDIETLDNPTLDINCHKAHGRGVFFVKNSCNSFQYYPEKKTIVLIFEI